MIWRRRNRSPEFKAKVALEAACKEKTVAQLSRVYGVHANHIGAWKRQLVEGASSLFTSSVESPGRRGGIQGAPGEDRRVDDVARIVVQRVEALSQQERTSMQV